MKLRRQVTVGQRCSIVYENVVKTLQIRLGRKSGEMWAVSSRSLGTPLCFVTGRMLSDFSEICNVALCMGHRLYIAAMSQCASYLELVLLKTELRKRSR